jgi:DNA-binding transcriptional regulator YiaG
MTITTPLPRPAELAEQLRPATEPPLPSPAERRRLRNQAGVTLIVAARHIGVDIKTLRAWELGIRDRPQGDNRRIYLVLLEAFRILAQERAAAAEPQK